MGKLAAVITVFLTTPIWFYLLYQILSSIEASELAWFLYWVYLPFMLVAQLLSQIIINEK